MPPPELITYECFGCGNFVVRPSSDPADAPCPFEGCTERGSVKSFGESDWLSSDEPFTMRQALEALCGTISARKRRLLRCELCRRLYATDYDEILWRVLDAASEYADGRLSRADRERIEERLFDVPESYGFHPTWFSNAFTCIEDDDEDRPWPGDYWRVGPTQPEQVREVGATAANCYREFFGNPFRHVTLHPAWRTDTAVALARQMYESRDFGAMPILADALQDTGCNNEDILDHCRSSGPHVRGCWAVDVVLGNG